MEQKLALYQVQWSAADIGRAFGYRAVPGSNLLCHYFLGADKENIGRFNYFGLVVVPQGMHPQSVLEAEFLNVKITECRKAKQLADTAIGQHPNWNYDWGGERLRYFAATGGVYNAPIIEHYDFHGRELLDEKYGWTHEDKWKCTTLTELFNLS